MIVLGIDTSCYTTSVAAADENGVLVSNRKLLPVAAGERGLRQSEAVFTHIKQLPQLFEDTVRELDKSQIRAVSVSVRPRDNGDSYMPVFLSGTSFARVAAASLGVPVLETTHQRGHIRAALQDSGLKSDKYLAVHLSGGTTEVVLMDGNELNLLAGTKDLHAGQVIDRIGVAMDLPFPAGPSLEKLAMNGVSESRLSVSMDGCDCHLSGVETKAARWVKEGVLPRETIAAEVFGVIERTVLRMLEACSAKTGVKEILLTGGVASSGLFREQLQALNAKRRTGLKLFFGKQNYSGDNAAGVALIGIDQMKAGRYECTTD